MEAIESVFRNPDDFDSTSIHSAMTRNTAFPFIVIGLYLLMVKFGPQFMESRRPFQIKGILLAWNALLATFSMVGCIATTPRLIQVVYTKGAHYTLCTQEKDWYMNGTVGFWVMLFILSKFPEMIDTCFLVIEKKPVIFLHWFHHATVAMFCWHSYIHRIPTGFYFMAMNYFIHSVMYSYYFLMCTPLRRFVRPIAPLITSLQIAQMFFGIAIESVSAMLLSDDTCFINTTNLMLGGAIYAAYFVLFIKFFVDVFLRKKRSKLVSSSSSLSTAVKSHSE